MPKGIQVEFKGEMRFLSKLADSHGISRNAANWRWVQAGRPETVTAELFNPSTGRQLKVMATFNGERMSMVRIAEKAGVSLATVRKKRKLLGIVLTSADLVVNKNIRRKKPAKSVYVVLSTSPAQLPTVDRSPGWLERREFPNAGNGGFGKVERCNFAGFVNKGGSHFPVYAE